MSKKKKKTPAPPPESEKKGDRISVREWVLLLTALAQFVTAVISFFK
ncbi:hypothetical protein M5X00_06290 [Paenibacillus alvei]|uniref:Holin n=1 Tax=Paenibacillus alvei TaxID=44250 RepID=A0ABT4H7P5_PAEAL|nr:hypothetical protein [Paenibacillus alvei]MCY9544859.1 hypothetical protein [Paenibacillus alvei]MCY9708728.1 hypothetical protein [Paenibacillus alvei]MCY9732270.1 hypothetical protein [Paenibacillus alvei]MCY9753865.1 hypothetical protein [Paenibacillus alvei]MCY9764995.1 hypothetical protein [Paenibacillus alvei]